MFLSPKMPHHPHFWTIFALEAVAGERKIQDRNQEECQKVAGGLDPTMREERLVMWSCCDHGRCK